MKKKSQRGQTIVEVIIATGVVALVMTALVSVVAVSIRNAAFAKASALATKHSQEGTEFFRREYNVLGWETFLQTIQTDGSSITYCLATIPANSTAFAALSNGDCSTSEFVDSKNLFQRFAEVTISGSPGSELISVVTKVTWRDGALDREVQIAQEFRMREL